MNWKLERQRMIKWLTAAALLVTLLAPTASHVATAAGPGDNVLTLTLNKAQVSVNGTTYASPQPALIVKGVTYAPVSMLAARFGHKITYNASSKSYTVSSEGNAVEFKPGSTAIWLNGAKTVSSGKPYIYKGSLMVPLRDWVKATGSTLSAAPGTVSLTWSVAPTADFKVDQDVIYAGETQVTYTSLSKNPNKIWSESWDGNLSVFPEPGTYVITRSVQDMAGNWLDPYAVTITVLPPNQPPVAQFTTDKDTYMIGEPITYTDQSTDDENAIVSAEWSNNKRGFFVSGPQTISLRVTDRHGSISDFSKTINITTDVMYTEKEFNERFTLVGDKYPVIGSDILKIPTVPYTYYISNRALIASDSPEDLTGPGILYRDTLYGDLRLFLYHQNLGSEPLKIYLAATNESATESAALDLGAWGSAGPETFGAYTGKMAAIRYLDSRDNLSTSTTWLAPGATKLIVPELNQKALTKGQTFSAYADLSTSTNVKFTLFAVKSGDDPLTTLPTLGVMKRDGKHIRGTFQGADREIVVNDTLGDTPKRIVFGDHSIDPALDGIDQLNGQPENNWGNFGVVYHMTVQVKANTLISLNARGGIYTGAFLVNGIKVPVTNTSILENPNVATPVYRTGQYNETVVISYLTALGSNLPITLMFIPMK